MAESPSTAEDPFTRLNECYNCGATGKLLRCSRCKFAWFCSISCAKAYWPVHKSECKVNEFAASIEAAEPKFAAWMRQHGKQAIIKDDEVERLERASRAVCALPSRQEVMESMYGRADPRPAAPTYSAEEWLAMQRAEQKEINKAKCLTPQERVWQALPAVQPGLGLEVERYRWTQDLSYVLVHIKLPPYLPADQVHVSLTPSHLSVTFGSEVYLSNRLYKDIELSDSTWLIDAGVLHIQLLKAARRGRYTSPAPRLLLAAEPASLDKTAAVAGEVVSSNASAIESTPAHRQPAMTAANTFWWSLIQEAPAEEQLQGQHPPTQYYFARELE